MAESGLVAFVNYCYHWFTPVLADKDDVPKGLFPSCKFYVRTSEDCVYRASSTREERGRYQYNHAETDDDHDASDDRIFCLFFSRRPIPLLEHIYRFWYNPAVSIEQKNKVVWR